MTQTELQEIVRQCRVEINNGLSGSSQALDGFKARLDALESRTKHGGIGWSQTDALTAALSKRPTELLPGKVLATIDLKDIIGVSQQFPAPYAPVAVLAQATVGGVRSLIPTTTTESGAVSWIQEDSFTNNADVVAEGAAKPKSDKVFSPKELIVRTIAHIFKMSKAAADDLPAMVSVVENNGIYGVQAKTEQQILKGTGTAPQLQGIYPLATPVSAPVAGDTLIDTWFKAVAQLGAAGYNATGIVVSWADWSATNLLKDTSGRYILTDLPQLPRRVVSPYLNVGEWLVGDFVRGAHIFSRQQITVEIATTNEDDFGKNMLSLRAEERLALAVWRPSAFLKNPAVGAMGTREL